MRLQHEFAQGYNYLHPALSTLKSAAQGKGTCSNCNFVCWVPVVPG